MSKTVESTDKKWTAAALWISAAIFFLIYCLIITRHERPFVLQTFSPLYELMIVKGQALRAWMPSHQYLFPLFFWIILIILLAAAGIKYPQKKHFPLIFAGLSLSVLGQYLIVKEFPYFGVWCHLWGGIIVLRSMIKNRKNITFGQKLPLSWRWILLGLLMFVAFTVIFYRLDRFRTDYYLWSEPGLYDLVRIMDGKLNPLEYSVVWGQGRQTTSGENIFYVAMAVAFFKLLGVKFLTIRMLNATAALITLPLVYLCVKRFFSSSAALLTLFLISFSTWHWHYIRSETHVFFTVPLALLAYCFFLNGLSKPSLPAFFAAGIVCGIMPYFYAPLRIIPIVLLLYLIIRSFIIRTPVNQNNNKLLSLVKVKILPHLLLILGFSIPTLPQFQHLQQVKNVYFSGRGEQVFNMTKHPHIMKKFIDDPSLEPPYPISLRIKVAGKIIFSNLQKLMKNFAGLMPGRTAWDETNFVRAFLFPFVIVGIFACLANIKKEPYLIMLIWTFFGIAPTLAANMVLAARPLPVLVPIHFFAAQGIIVVLSELSGLFSKILGRIVIIPALAGLCLFTAVMSTAEYFNPAKQDGAQKLIMITALDIRKEISKRDVYVIYPTWTYYAEGVIAFENYEETHSQDAYELNFHLFDSDFEGLMTDIKANPEKYVAGAFYICNNPELPENRIALDLAELIRQQFPESKTTSVSFGIVKIVT